MRQEDSKVNLDIRLNNIDSIFAWSSYLVSNEFNTQEKLMIKHF